MGNFISISCRVNGRVQGVGFRRFVQKLGQQHQIGGWVKNNFDGSVSFEARGSEEQVRCFVDAVKKGSFLARVDEIDEIKTELLEEAPSAAFEIRY